MYKTIVEAVLAHAAAVPDKTAICFKKQCLTYRQLAGQIRAFAFLLRKRDRVGAGDVVMISALSKPEFIVAMLAAQYLGATVVPVDKSALSATLSWLYHFVQPRVFLSDSRTDDNTVKKASLKEYCAQAQEILRTKPDLENDMPYRLPDMDGIGEIIFTTGTTGRPKGAAHSYANLLASTIATRDGVHRNADCVELLPLPLNHSFGLRVMRTLLYVGATIVLQNGFMFPKELETNLERYACTGMAIVPASMERLYQNMGVRFAGIIGRLSYIEVSAGSLSVGMKQRLMALLPDVRLYNVWGSSETGGVIFLDLTRHPEHIASLGQAIPGAEVCMVSQEGDRYLAHSIETAGRMAIKGPMQMREYYRAPELTKETVVDGYLYTGDLAYQTEDGFIYMIGRADDIINVGGEKVSPVEVEDTASLYPDIRECACVGWQDPEGVLGQIPVLFVVPEGRDIEEKEIAAFLATRLEPYKMPRKYVVVDELPRNAMKKIDRKKLKQRLERGEGADLQRNSVISAIYGRRSVRDFLDKPVPRETLELLVECGCHAPSGHNMQSWRFTVVSSKQEIERLKCTIPPVAKRNKVYFYGFNDPAALILISNDRRNPDGIQDSSCAAQNIMLAAHSLGLGSVWINALMKLCDEPEIRSILNCYQIPQTHNVWAIIALGYPANRPGALAKKTDVVRWIEEESKPMDDAIALDAEKRRGGVNDLIAVILGGYEPCRFAARRIPRALLEEVVNCGYQAPCGHNLQSWRFTVLYGEEPVRRFESMTAKTGAKGAAAAGCGDPGAIVLISIDRRDPYGMQDCACAAQNILLAARSTGLGANILYDLELGRDAPSMDDLQREFCLPATHDVCVVLALGWPEAFETLPMRKTDTVCWTDEE